MQSVYVEGMCTHVISCHNHACTRYPPPYPLSSLSLSMHSCTYITHGPLTFKQNYWRANIQHKYYTTTYIGCLNITSPLFHLFNFRWSAGPWRVAWDKSRMCSGTPSHPWGSGNIIWSNSKSLRVPSQASSEQYKNRCLHLLPCLPIRHPDWEIGFYLHMVWHLSQLICHKLDYMYLHYCN